MPTIDMKQQKEAPSNSEKGGGLLADETQMRPSDVDPRAQQQYDLFVANGIKIIHSEKFSNTLVATFKRIKDADRAIDFIATATLSVISKLEASAIERKIKIKANALLQASNLLMGEIIMLAEACGVELDQDQKAQAFSLGISMYLSQAVKSGKIKPQVLHQYAEQLKATPNGEKMLAEQQKALKSGPGKKAAPPEKQMSGGLLEKGRK